MAEAGTEFIPFKVTYRSRYPSATDLKELFGVAGRQPLERAYVATRSVNDLGEMECLDTPLRVMRIPAPLLCYRMGSTELEFVNATPSE